MSEAGSVVWPTPANPIWRFNWALEGSPDAEGIVISGGYFRGHEVFYKASLPSLRVQYDGNACGPYKDPLSYDDAHPTGGGSNRVNVYSLWFFGFHAVVVDAYHTIGNYKLTERWTFWNDGQVSPRLFSAGLQCNVNHRHHVYWRFDFDIDGAANNLALEYNTTPLTLVGARAGTRSLMRSCASRILRHDACGRYCRRAAPSAATWSFPEARMESLMDSRAEISGYCGITGLRTSTDGREARKMTDSLLYNGEPTDGQDLVLWYCGHLAHDAADGGAELHSCGPDLIPFRY